MENTAASFSGNLLSQDEGDSDTFSFGMERNKAGRKAGRKAKRALRKRINPKQQPCCERMVGPVLEQLPRGVPKLPRGGDGLAMVSLRPSLGPHGTFASVQASSSEVKVSSPRRPHTASGQQHQAGRVQRRGSKFGRRRLEASSGLPIAPSSTDGKLADGSVGQVVDIEHSSRVPETHCISGEWRDPQLQDSVEYSQISPLRPESERGSARQYADAGHRTFRSKETSAPSSQRELQTAHDDDQGASEGPPTKPRLDQDPSKGPDTSDENEMANHPFSQLLTTADSNQGERDEDAWSQSVGGDGRSATVVLSSTVLLSPRGRARTPTLTVPDGSPATDGAGRWGATSQDYPEDWAHVLSPRPHTAPDGSCFGRNAWHDPPSAYDLPNTCFDERWIPPATGIRQHMASQV